MDTHIAEEKVALIREHERQDQLAEERGTIARGAEQRRGGMVVAVGFLSFTLVLLAISFFLPSCASARSEASASAYGEARVAPLDWHNVKRQATTSSAAPSASATAGVLECFQVHQPVLTPAGPTLDSDPSPASSVCTQVIMDHVFAYSYNEPFVANYTPPSCSFNRVAMNFTVTSAGRQFDRLALMYFGDTEVWRTSTAEPTTAPGIRWVYLKDMTEYLYFWKSPQTLIFDLGNLIDSTYTGTYNTTLTVTYFTEEVDTGAAPPSDLILPISKKLGSLGQASDFIYPGDSANATLTLPRNVNKAIFSVSANGQANEEFWWSNVLQSDINAFEPTAGTFTGYSPFREVQVYIDGQLAGVQWAFPVIFTGGVVPSLHRPIVGLDAFDLREHEIDITPWLGLLCDGQPHTFEIKVSGLNDDGKRSGSLSETTGASWYITGKIFLWLDEDVNSITTGDVATPTIVAPTPSIYVSQKADLNGTGTYAVNETLAYDVRVKRALSISNTITTQHGSSVAEWSQTLSYSQRAFVSAYGFNEINDMTISGKDVSSAGYKTEYKYPLYCNSTYGVSATGNLSITAYLVQGLQLYVEGPAVFPTGLEAFSNEDSKRKYAASLLTTTKTGNASFSEYGDNSKSFGFGSSDQVFTFSGFDKKGGGLGSRPDHTLYTRHAAYVNGSITVDDEEVLDQRAKTAVPSAVMSSQVLFPQAPKQGGTGPRVFMGRQGDS